MGLFRCSTGCGFEYTTPTVQLNLMALPIASALKLPPHLERLVDFVQEELDRVSKCPKCGGELSKPISSISGRLIRELPPEHHHIRSTEWPSVARRLLTPFQKQLLDEMEQAQGLASPLGINYAATELSLLTLFDLEECDVIALHQLAHSR